MATSLVQSLAAAPNAVIAVQAGLRYVSDTLPGLSRVRATPKLVVKDSSGRRVTDAATLDRVRALVIPPAWTNVWISPNPHGHIQAVGRDARGRKQYRYHANWTRARGASKFEHVVAFGEALPKIRAVVDADLRKHALSRERVLATIVRIMEKTAIRVGNEEYARTNGSYGLTTLRCKHVRVTGGKVRFDFRAKSGVLQHIELDDARLAGIVKRCQDLPGQTLFQYIDENGQRRDVDSADVNDYVKAASGGDFTAKDFRTWVATVMASIELAALAASEADASQTRRKRLMNEAIGKVAAHLGNTKTVCRQCYIHPRVLESFMDGGVVKPVGRANASELAQWEAGVIRFLKQPRVSRTRH